VKLEDWAGAYTLAWEQMRVCEFCGFTRMAPCKTRQVCPNLTDYRLEDDSVAPREGSDQLEAAE
jgi:hypothetical protein